MTFLLLHAWQSDEFIHCLLLSIYLDYTTLFVAYIGIFHKILLLVLCSLSMLKSLFKEAPSVLKLC